MSTYIHREFRKREIRARSQRGFVKVAIGLKLKEG